MSKKILKPNKKIKTINIDEIEIRTKANKILKSFIPEYICLTIILLCEVYCMYRIKKVDICFILIILMFLILSIYRFIVSNWTLEINNSKLFITYELKKYIIDLNNLISIEPKYSKYKSREMYYLNIIFEENQKLKEINLIYNVRSPYFCGNYANIGEINYLINSIEYNYYEPILDGDSLNLNINKKEIFMVIMIILIGWTILNIILFIMMKF